MEFLFWVLLALAAYSFIAPLASEVTKTVPPSEVMFLSTCVFLFVTLIVLGVTGTASLSYLASSAAIYVYVAAVFLTVGVFSYTAALEAGPVSVVVPIFGMFIVGSSALGIVFLDEALTVTRFAGIVCAIIAIYLSGGEAE